MKDAKINKATIGNNPYIGLFCATNDKTTLVPATIEKKEEQKIQDTLGTETIKAKINGSYLLGVFIKGNNNAFITAENSTGTDTKKLVEQGVNIQAINADHNAIGNLLTTNDYGTIISHELKKHSEELKQALKTTQVTPARIAGLDVVGSCVTATNKGFIANPDITEEEFTQLEKTLKTSGAITTANYGDVMTSNSVLANNNGILVGEKTTSPEILRIMETLN